MSYENETNSPDNTVWEWPDGDNYPGAYDGTYEQPQARPAPRGAGALGAVMTGGTVEYAS